VLNESLNKYYPISFALQCVTAHIISEIYRTANIWSSLKIFYRFSINSNVSVELRLRKMWYKVGNICKEHVMYQFKETIFNTVTVILNHYNMMPQHKCNKINEH
jgi:hypothetical protein